MEPITEQDLLKIAPREDFENDLPGYIHARLCYHHNELLVEIKELLIEIRDKLPWEKKFESN